MNNQKLQQIEQQSASIQNQSGVNELIRSLSIDNNQFQKECQINDSNLVENEQNSNSSNRNSMKSKNSGSSINSIMHSINSAHNKRIKELEEQNLKLKSTINQLSSQMEELQQENNQLSSQMEELQQTFTQTELKNAQRLQELQQKLNAMVKLFDSQGRQAQKEKDQKEVQNKVKILKSESSMELKRFEQIVLQAKNNGQTKQQRVIQGIINGQVMLKDAAKLLRVNKDQLLNKVKQRQQQKSKQQLKTPKKMRIADKRKGKQLDKIDNNQ